MKKIHVYIFTKDSFLKKEIGLEQAIMFELTNWNPWILMIFMILK